VLAFVLLQPCDVLYLSDVLVEKVRTVLEIGMFTGTTTLSLAMVSTVEKVVSLELEKFLEETNRPFFNQSGVSEKIEIRIGDALSSLDKLVEEKASFDMVSWLATQVTTGGYNDD
jgi:predicted O-methyltransferase YrrM